MRSNPYLISFKFDIIAKSKIGNVKGNQSLCSCNRMDLVGWAIALANVHKIAFFDVYSAMPNRLLKRPKGQWTPKNTGPKV